MLADSLSGLLDALHRELRHRCEYILVAGHLADGGLERGHEHVALAEEGLQLIDLTADLIRIAHVATARLESGLEGVWHAE